MKKFRTIYMIEAFTTEGVLRVRRFGANKRTALKIAKSLQYIGDVYIKKLNTWEHDLVNPVTVERI